MKYNLYFCWFENNNPHNLIIWFKFFYIHIMCHIHFTTLFVSLIIDTNYVSMKTITDNIILFMYLLSQTILSHIVVYSDWRIFPNLNKIIQIYDFDIRDKQLKYVFKTHIKYSIYCVFIQLMKYQHDIHML